MAGTGERRLLCLLPLKDTATDSDRYVPLHPTYNNTSVFLCGDTEFKLFIPVFFKIGKENPEYLIAHAYTRYLGDLSGGQFLKRIAQKSMGLNDDGGLSFYAFPGVNSPNLFKQLYRSRMNSVELTEEETNGVLEEAVRAFELNIQVRSSILTTNNLCSSLSNKQLMRLFIVCFTGL